MVAFTLETPSNVSDPSGPGKVTESGVVSKSKKRRERRNRSRARVNAELPVLTRLETVREESVKKGSMHSKR